MIESSLIQVPIIPIPNQSLTITLDNNLYNITLKETNGVMSSTIIRNNVLIQSNARISVGYYLIQYKYKTDGNFFMITENDEYPYYTKFGSTQFLLYIPKDAILLVERGKDS